MKTVQYAVETANITVAAWMHLVQEHLDAKSACILAESPQRVVLRMLREGLTEAEILESTSCIVFDSCCELRLEKAPGTKEGVYRCIRDHAGAEKTACVRESRYHLRRAPEGDNTARQLVYVEYFAEEESGMLVPVCARLAGVEQGGMV